MWNAELQICATMGRMTTEGVQTENEPILKNQYWRFDG